MSSLNGVSKKLSEKNPPNLNENPVGAGWGIVKDKSQAEFESQTFMERNITVLTTISQFLIPTLKKVPETKKELE